MKYFCVIIILFLFPALSAQNNVRLISRQGIPFTVYAGDKPLSQNPQSEFVITGIMQDTLKLKVAFGQNRYGITLLLLEKGRHTANREFNYLLTLDKNRVIPRFLSLKELTKTPSPLVPERLRADSAVNKINSSGLYELQNGRIVFRNNLPGKPPCKSPMPQRYLELSTSLLLKAQTPTEKTRIVEQVILNNCFDTHQLRELLGFIDYETEKLKMAKLAYTHLSNPSQAEHLLNIFRFPASRTEFSRFIVSPASSGNKTCASPCDSTDLHILQQNIEMFASDSQKLSELKKSYALLCYNTGQIEKLLSSFVHDREKLLALALLFDRCSDPQNYAMLEGILSNGESKSEFTKFVAKQRQ